jgi:pilus assembly protein CpaE
MIKTVLLISRIPWALEASDLGLPNGVRLVRIEGELGFQLSKAKSTNPDIVFVANYPADASLVSQLRFLVRAVPLAVVAPICPHPSPEFLIEAMRAGVAEVLASNSIDALKEALPRLRDRALANPKRSQSTKAEVIGLMSAKGGDGGGCLAANLGAALSAADEPARVLLIDLALPFGDLEMYLTKTNPTHDLADIAVEMDRLDAPLLDSMTHHLTDQLHIISTPLALDKSVKILPAHVGKLLSVAASNYDYILINLSASVDQITVSALDKLNRLAIVSTSSLLSLRRCSQLLGLWSSLGYSQNNVSIVLNKQDSKPELTLQEFEQGLGLKIEREIPRDESGMQSAVLKGLPLVELQPRSAFSKSLNQWAQELRGLPQKGKSIWERFGIK